MCKHLPAQLKAAAVN